LGSGKSAKARLCVRSNIINVMATDSDFIQTSL
jgi:hypothetical protein